MIIRRIIYILLMLAAFFISCDNYVSNGKKIIYEIDVDKLEVQLDSLETEIPIRIENKLGYSFILYNFLSLGGGWTDEINLTYLAKGGAGNVLYLFDENDNRLPNIAIQKFPGTPTKDLKIDSDSLAKMDNKEDKSYNFTSAPINYPIRFQKNALILPAFSDTIVHLRFDFRNYELEKDKKYKMFLLYSTGEKLESSIPKKVAIQDEKKYNAKVFRSWLKTNTIEVIVK